MYAFSTFADHEKQKGFAESKKSSTGGNTIQLALLCTKATTTVALSYGTTSSAPCIWDDIRGSGLLSGNIYIILCCYTAPNMALS